MSKKPHVEAPAIETKSAEMKQAAAAVESPSEPFFLDRLELARRLPEVGSDAKVSKPSFSPGSIEAFRTEDGRTMLVVAVDTINDGVVLAAQEIPEVAG